MQGIYYNGYKLVFENVAKELFRIIKKGGVVIWVVGDKTDNGSESGTSFKQALFFQQAGFNIHDTMIYYKNNPMPTAGHRYHQHFEYMFAFSKTAPKTLPLFFILASPLYLVFSTIGLKVLGAVLEKANIYSKCW